MKTFGVIGLGFIYNRHLEAIESNGGKIVIGCDIDKSKKDKLPQEALFTEDWKKIRGADYISILTPNHLHKEMAKEFAKQGKIVLVEKPAVISHKELKELSEYDNVYTVLQLRHHPAIFKLKERIDYFPKYKVFMKILVRRDDWYFKSWKADHRRSGGLLFNIGIHYFDLLVYLFGPPINVNPICVGEKRAWGNINFKNAAVEWEISLEAPMDNQKRLLTINDERIDLSQYFENLHIKVYENLLNNKGIHVKECEETIKLIEALKHG